MAEPNPAVCSRFHRAVELIGRRWTGALIQALLQGRARYAVLRDAIPDISDRMLCERLKELEAEGIVSRIVTPDTPVRVEYELTRKGRGLNDAVQAISAWAHEWIPASPAGRPARAATARTSRRRSA
jgi:DNA-binding HxlR family transcriptional regulator